VPGGLGLSRWWLALLPLAVLFMLFGATPQQTHAQSPATNTPLPTATPTFVWLVPNSPRGACGNGINANDDCLHIDPINQQFVYYPDKRTPNATPISARVRDMKVSQQSVTWKWNDTAKNYFVWGTVDRVRKTVRMTLWRRERSGVAQSQLFSSGTPRLLPIANDPRIVIQDNRFVPNRLVINRNQQINFQNQMRQPMSIKFVAEHTGGVEPSNPSWLFVGDFCRALPNCVLPAGRIAPPFPIRPPNPPTPVPDADPIEFWSRGTTFTYYCEIHQNFKRGTVQVRDD
jgi:hypothetical protein